MRKRIANPGADAGAPSKALRLLRLPSVEDRTGLRHSQIHALERRGQFPARVNISTRAAGWLEHEIDQWIADRVTASRGSRAT